MKLNKFNENVKFDIIDDIVFGNDENSYDEFEIEIELIDKLDTGEISIEDLKLYIKNNFAGGHDGLIEEIIKKMAHTKHLYKNKKLIRSEITDTITMKDFSKEKLIKLLMYINEL